MYSQIQQEHSKVEAVISPNRTVSQGAIAQKREHFKFEIRKKKLQEEFSKKRVQIAKLNEETFNAMQQVHRILNSFPNSSQITTENQAIILKCLQLLLKVSALQYQNNQVSQFLIFVAKEIAQLDKNNLLISQTFKKIALLVHQIIDRFTAQPDKQCIEFLHKIYPVATNEIFMDLQHNIYCNQMASISIKQQLFSSLIGFMMDKKKPFFENRVAYLSIIQVAITCQPSLKESYILKMMTNLNDCYSLINLQYDRKQTDQTEIARIIKITKKIMKYQKFKQQFFRYNHISDVIKYKITDQQHKDSCLEIIGVAISQKQNLQHLIKSQPVILVRLQEILHEFVLKDSYLPSNSEQIRHIFFLFSNFVCSPQGARYFFEYKFYQLIVFILEKVSKKGNRKILTEAIYIFVNLIFVLFETLEKFTKEFLQFLNDQKYQQFLYLAIQQKILESLAIQTIYKILITEGLPKLQILTNSQIKQMLISSYSKMENQTDRKITEQILYFCQNFGKSYVYDM